MGTVSLRELQQDTDALLDRVEAGEHLVMVRDSPVAELRPGPAAKARARAAERFGKEGALAGVG